MLGGSSSINVTVWTRGHRSDYDGWAKHGCTGWDYDQVLPYFRRSETFVGGRSPYRGVDGPMHVGYSGLRHPLSDAFVETLRSQGYPFNPDLNGEDEEGVGYLQVSQRRGLRHSAAQAYLSPARRRHNLTLRKHAVVTKIAIQDGRARGVVYRSEGREITAIANKEVILAAGALASPKILMLSGIGPSDELRRHGIDILVDSPGVGQGLQEHPRTQMVFGANVPTVNMELNPKGMLKHGLEFLLHGTGPVTSAGVTSAAFLRLRQSEIPDFEIIFAPLGIGLKDPTKSADELSVQDFGPMNIPAVMASLWLCHPRSRGTVTLRSARPEDPPVIRHQLIGADSDKSDLMFGCRFIRDLFAAEPLSHYITSEIAPGTETHTDEQFEAFLRTATHRGEHPSGTCRMGSDSAAVVDPELRVQGIQGLRVIDASVIPSLITGHTNAAVIMIAERASDLIRGAEASRQFA